MNISSFNTAGDWVRPYLWLFEVVTKPAALTLDIPADTDIYLVKGKIPKQAQNLITVKWGGEWANYGGSITKTEPFVEWTLRCDRKLVAWNFFRSWSQLSGRQSDGSALNKSQYTGAIKISLLDTDKSIHLAEFVFTQVFFYDGFDLELDKEKEDAFTTFPINMAFDKFDPVILNPAPAIALS